MRTKRLQGFCTMRLKMVDLRLLNPSCKPLVHECLGWFKAVQTACQTQQVQKKLDYPKAKIPCATNPGATGGAPRLPC